MAPTTTTKINVYYTNYSVLSVRQGHWSWESSYDVKIVLDQEPGTPTSLQTGFEPSLDQLQANCNETISNLVPQVQQDSSIVASMAQELLLTGRRTITSWCLTPCGKNFAQQLVHDLCLDDIGSYYNDQVSRSLFEDQSKINRHVGDLCQISSLEILQLNSQCHSHGKPRVEQLPPPLMSKVQAVCSSLGPNGPDSVIADLCLLSFPDYITLAESVADQEPALCLNISEQGIETITGYTKERHKWELYNVQLNRFIFDDMMKHRMGEAITHALSHSKNWEVGTQQWLKPCRSAGDHAYEDDFAVERVFDGEIKSFDDLVGVS